MKSSGKLQNLENEQESEFAALHARFAAISEMLQTEASAPANFVRAHPYITTGGAAAIGFVAAQLIPAIHISLPSIPAKPVAAPAPAAPVAVPTATIMGLLMSLAQQYFMPQMPAPGVAPSLDVADVGTVRNASAILLQT